MKILIILRAAHRRKKAAPGGCPEHVERELDAPLDAGIQEVCPYRPYRPYYPPKKMSCGKGQNKVK
jgi:hypothetical protein